MKKSKEFLLQRIGSYDICGKNLGKGSFARVELANHRLTNTKVALKILDLDEVKESYIRKNVLRESAILKNLRHDNIVHLYETLAHHNTYCFVTEYLEGGDLLTFIREQKQGCLNEKHARKIFLQLQSAVQYLHSRGIIHRDLKLQNIMLTENKKKIKLVDFGLSNFLNKDNLLKTQCGSAEYAAPELFDKGSNYGPSVEIWSMGVVLFAITTGRMPFQAGTSDKKENFIVQIRRGLNISHENVLKKVSSDLKNLLSLMLEPDKDKRINLTGIICHSWITENGRCPALPIAPNLIPRDIRRQVIERVANLINRSVDETTHHLRLNTFDSISATYHIILDNTLKFFETKNNPRSSSAPAKFFKMLKSRSQSGSSSTEFTPMPAKQRKITTPPSIRIKTPVNKELLNENTPTGVHPVASCLKISKKSPCHYTKTPTSPKTRVVDTSDDLKQTPFRLSPTSRTSQQRKPKPNRYKTQPNFDKKIESNLIETTIEGEFEVNSKSSTEDDGRNQVEIESNQIRVVFSGEALKSGSFKITEKTVKFNEAPPTRVHTKSRGDQEKRTTKSCTRCLSPYEARQMLHRDTFPLKKTLVKPSHTNDFNPEKVNLQTKYLYSHPRLMKEKKKYEHTYQNEVITKFISNTGTLIESVNPIPCNSKENLATQPLSRCTIHNADEILKYESRINENISKSNGIRISKSRQMRRVSFKE